MLYKKSLLIFLLLLSIVGCTNDKSVYVCMDSDSVYYHKNEGCQELNSCSSFVSEVDISKARDINRRPCKMCRKPLYIRVMPIIITILSIILWPLLMLLVISLFDWIKNFFNKIKNTMKDIEVKQEQKQESISVNRNILNPNVADSLVVVLKWIKILIIVYIIQMIIFIPVEFASIMDNVKYLDDIGNIWQAILYMLF